MRRRVRLLVAVVMALLAAIALGVVMTGLTVFATSGLTRAAPSDKALVLAKTISEAMNCAAMFPVFTLPVAIFLALKGANGKAATRVALAALAGLFVAFASSVAWGVLTSRAPSGASDAQRASAAAGAVAAALYNGALLAMLTVPGAAAIAWRARHRRDLPE
ncbi:MAG: hypothetical protein ACLQVI_12265 [Polyangiaceae bacterium]